MRKLDNSTLWIDNLIKGILTHFAQVANMSLLLLVVEVFTKAVRLQVLPFNRTFWQAASYLGHFVGILGPIAL